MNYEKIYNQLIEKCKVRGLDKSKHEGYYEIHHIVPRCLGGSNEKDNLVMFTGREHFIAHMLLWKAYPKVKGLAYAVNIMSNRLSIKLNSRSYEKLKTEVFPRPTLTEGVMFKDKTNLRFGKLTVLRLVEWIPRCGDHSLPIWQCLCDCGRTVNIRGNHLTPKGTKSCGCLLSIALKNSASMKSPWELSMTKERWASADVYYDMWVELGRPNTSWKFSKLYNERESSDFSASYFTAILLSFNSGWIPSEDKKWLEYKRESYE